MRIPVNLPTKNYEILLERGALDRFGETVGNRRKVLILTDSGVPSDYVERVKKQCESAVVFTVPAGEQSKNFEMLQAVLHQLLSCGFRRGDCLAALGGGVVGDLGGFAASCYMRGIGFYTLPTTLLAQVDSSVGGKTAIDFEGVKNAVGAFYQPDGVFVDPDVLRTLPKRQFSAGMAEIMKMALTFDASLFEKIENEPVGEISEEIIAAALRMKKTAVEKDEKESGLRRVLNFGHTLGHGIESERAGQLLHGECVALGMLPMMEESVRKRAIPVMKKYDLPLTFRGDVNAVLSAVAHDKKNEDDGIMTILVDKIGSFYEKKQSIDDLKQRLNLLKP